MLSPRRVGRLAAAFFIVAGVVSILVLAAPQTPDLHRTANVIVGLSAVCAGVACSAIKWDRLHRLAPAIVVPTALILMATGAIFGGIDPFTYSIYFALLFVWIGLALPKRASFVAAPAAASAYVFPLLIAGRTAGEIASTATVVPICLLIGEGTAWVAHLLRGAEHEAGARLHLVLEQVSLFAATVDTNGRITYCNPAFFAVTGWRRDEVIGRPWHEICSNGSDLGYPLPRRMARNDPAHREELSVRTKDGGTRQVIVSWAIAHDERGEAIGMTCIGEDITDHREAQERLLAALEREQATAAQQRSVDEMKNTFLQAVSHELRTPLTAILGFSKTLEREAKLPPALRHQLLRRLTVNAEKLHSLLADLLDLDRLERGVMLHTGTSMVDVGALVRGVVEQMDLEGRRIELDTPSVEACIDEPMVERIIENLVANAIKYTEPTARIWVRVTPAASDGVLITVEQEGTTIPEDLRVEIFEPFRRGHIGNSFVSGTGIGLTLVKRFTDLHGGRVWVEDRPGGGTLFKVYLPNAPRRAHASV